MVLEYQMVLPYGTMVRTRVPVPVRTGVPRYQWYVRLLSQVSKCPARTTTRAWNPQTRTTTETVLREAMQALVRVQDHMLARIVVEIRAADIAVELEPQLLVYRDAFYADNAH